MEGFVDEVPMIIQAVLIVGIVGIFVLGYTIAAQYIGFGSHVVKKTETFEYEDDALAKLRDAEKQAKRSKHAGARRTDPPTIEDVKKRTITTETQTSKTFWDWMTVLTISAVIGVGALLFSQHQATQQRVIQDQQAKDAALLAYLDSMSELIFDRHLLKSHEDDAVRDVAKARTLVALLDVGPEHHRDIIRFLYESEAINTPNGIVDLSQANLQDASLQRMPSKGIDLSAANFSDGPADENQRGAQLNNDDLRNADLEDANLKGANLEGANLEGANLSDGPDQNSHGARLSNGDLESANLTDANLRDAILRNAKLRGATLNGAVMPTGQNYEDWRSSMNSQ